MFITFRQNNSGGYYIENDDVAAYVIVEGNNVKEILDKANKIFKDYREYCPCCGERWQNRKTEYDLTNEPMIYSCSAYKYKAGWLEGKRAVIYKIDGTKEFIDLK